MRRRSRDTIRFFNLPDLPYVQAVCGVNVTNEFDRHVHNGFCIGMVQKGERIIDQGGALTIVPENSLFVINPDASHKCKSRYEEHSYFVICIEVERMKEIASQISEKAHTVPYFKNALICDSGLSSTIWGLFSLMENPGSTLEREACLDSLLSTLILNYGTETPIPSPSRSHKGMIKKVCELIRMHYAQDLTLKDLSKAACLSPFYFQRLFVENIGISPHDYMIQYRIKKARELLLEGHSIASVTVDTGFVDQSHFTRSFKRVTGITPGNYPLLSGNRRPLGSREGRT